MKSSIDEFLIILDKPARVHSPGDNFDGKIILKTNQAVKLPRLCLECRGEAYVSWPENHGTYTRYRFQREEYLNLKGCIYDQETSNQDVPEFHHASSYTFSFRVTIPYQALPPSYQSRHGFIRYCLFAEIQSKSGKSKVKTEEVLFTVGNYEEFDEDELEEITENEKQVVNGKDETIVLGSPCYPAGSVTLSAHTDKILYHNGGTINTSVRTDSEMTREAFDVDVSLVRATRYRDAKGHSTFCTDVIKSIDKQCLPETGKEHALELAIPRDVCPTMELACRWINVTYFIQVCMRRRNKSRKEATLMIPVIIVSSSSSSSSSRPSFPSSSSSSTSSSGIVADESVSKKSPGAIFYLTGSPFGTQNGTTSKPPRCIRYYDNPAVFVDDEEEGLGANYTNDTNRKRLESLV